MGNSWLESMAYPLHEGRYSEFCVTPPRISSTPPVREKNMEQPENSSFLWKNAILLLLLLFLKPNREKPTSQGPTEPKG